jgi:hypothetical protein
VLKKKECDRLSPLNCLLEGQFEVSFTVNTRSPSTKSLLSWVRLFSISLFFAFSYRQSVVSIMNR